MKVLAAIIVQYAELLQVTAFGTPTHAWSSVTQGSVERFLRVSPSCQAAVAMAPA